MSLTNYRDISTSGTGTNAGFQFEFSCSNCSHTWKSPFKPYRVGQLAGLIYRFAYFFGDRGSVSRTSTLVAYSAESRARASALEEALVLAGHRYTECPGCEKAACEDCWDGGARLCLQCAGKGEGSSSAAAEGGLSAKCSNCGSPMAGGRFCAECGFDVASTHKTCPGCGTLCGRAARFCTDCGHGF